MEFNTFRPFRKPKSVFDLIFPGPPSVFGIAASHLLGTLTLAEANVTLEIHRIMSSIAFGVPFQISRILHSFPYRMLKTALKLKRHLS